MTKLEKAYLTLQRLEMRHSASPAPIAPCVAVTVSLVYLAVMLSVPMGRLSMLLWFTLYPVIASAWCGIQYWKIFLKSLYILPLVALIGIFNPIYDHTPAFTLHGIHITTGWLSFCSIIVRGLLSMQCILILIETCGFTGICRALRRMGVPSFLTDQLQFVYRYLAVLLLEAVSMRRAREARGYGRRNYPLRLWSTMIGQLFLRAIDRSERINRAMQARGFSGTLPEYGRDEPLLHSRDAIYGLFMCAAIILLRICNLSILFTPHS